MTISMGAQVPHAISQVVHSRYVLCDTMSDLCVTKKLFSAEVLV